MPRQACLRCKQQKLRCLKEDGADACERCIRVGLECVKAPPSRQGKRSQSQQREGKCIRKSDCIHTPVLQAAKGSLTRLPTAHRVRTIMEACCGTNLELMDILSGIFDQVSIPSRKALLWTMRHFCALATGLGWVSLFQNALKIAASYGITISDVVLELEKELKEAPSLEDGALAPEMTAYLEQSSQAEGTFWVGRRLNPTRKGELVMWASSNFKAQVASEEALRAQWRRVGDDGSGGTTALWDAFVHPDDRSVIPMALGRVIATMPSFDPDVIGSKCEETTGLVRILMLQPGRGAAVTNVGLEPPPRVYVPCHVEVHMGVSRGMLWIGVKAAPLAQVLSTPAGSNAIDATVKDASSTEDSLRRSSASSSSASSEDGSQGDTLSSSGVTAARRADETVAQCAGGGDDLDTAMFDLFDPNDFFSTTALQ